MKTSTNHHEFFRTFFSPDELGSYSEKQVNGWWLLNQWDGNNKRWRISVYSPDSYRAYDAGRKKLQAKREERAYEESEYLRNINED